MRGGTSAPPTSATADAAAAVDGGVPCISARWVGAGAAVTAPSHPKLFGSLSHAAYEPLVQVSPLSYDQYLQMNYDIGWVVIPGQQSQRTKVPRKKS